MGVQAGEATEWVGQGLMLVYFIGAYGTGLTGHQDRGYGCY